MAQAGSTVSRRSLFALLFGENGEDFLRERAELLGGLLARLAFAICRWPG
jgi:hypothetical protein